MRIEIYFSFESINDGYFNYKSDDIKFISRIDRFQNVAKYEHNVISLVN